MLLCSSLSIASISINGIIGINIIMLLIHNKDFFLKDLTPVKYTLKQNLVDVVTINRNVISVVLLNP